MAAPVGCQGGACGGQGKGVACEAASLAGHLGLSNLCWIYDHNSVTLDGPAPLSFSEDVNRRFEGYHWHTQAVEDGNDIAAIGKAIQAAIDEKDRPSIAILPWSG